MYTLLLLFSFIYLTSCDEGKSVLGTDEQLFMGIDTVHNTKIDKDTIITRNLKLEKKNRGLNSKGNTISESSPDWSYSPFPKEVSNYVYEFKKNMSECLKEVQASNKKPIKRLSPKMDSPVHGECLIACVLKRNRVIENGKINKDNLISLLNKFFSKDTTMMKKLDKNLDRCIEKSTHSQDECQMASKLNDCTNDLMATNKHKITVNY